MTNVTTLDQLVIYVKQKKLSVRKLAKVSGYSVTYVRNCLCRLQRPSDTMLTHLIDAALNEGEQVTFSRQEMKALKRLLSVHDNMVRTVDDYEYRNGNPNMTDQQWKEFLGKLL